MSRKVLISGAGIAGLTAGLWLKRQGFEPVIVEQASAPLKGGFLVSLSDKAYQYAGELGVLSAMQERNMGITSSSYHNKNETTLLALDYQKLFENVDVLQIMRDDVVDVLYQTARDKMEIRFNDSIEIISNQTGAVEVGFTSGLQEKYDLAVIAEGPNSSTRPLLFPDSVTIDYLDLYCAAFRLPNVLNLENKFETHMQKGRYMAIFNTLEGDLGSVFIWSSDARKMPPKDEQTQTLLAGFDNAGTVIGRVLEHCPDQPHYMDILKQVKAEDWVVGRTVILGDAAHCMTLFSGRGAGAAITGASRLAESLKLQRDIPKALLSYEAANRPIIDPIQRQTRKAVRWYAPQNNLDWLLRDNAMRFLPNWLFQQYFNRKYSNV